jgi:uncharacterized RDD family membrane protein YckC
VNLQNRIVITQDELREASTFDSVEGVLRRRFMAYLIDIGMIFFFAMVLSVFVLILGFLTFGLGWMLFMILLPAAGILYSALTLGGGPQATIGMQMLDLQAIKTDGARVDALTAAGHALLFYAAAGSILLWIADVLIGLFRKDRRLGRDLIVNIILIRTGT